MKTLILCGGMGTRLKEETEYKPKPMVEIGDRPILWHIMRLYAFHGFKDFVLCLGFKGDLIKDYFLGFEARNSDFTIDIGSKKKITYHSPYEAEDLSITMANTGFDSLTGTRVRAASKYLELNDDDFMLTYGDGLSDVNIRELVKFHKSHGKLATITSIRPSTRFGVVKVDQQGTITKFEEKPIDSSWANAGYMVFNKRVLDYIPADADTMLEREAFEKLTRDGQLAAFKHEGFFYPMDTYRDYLALNKLWDSQQAPWAVWAKNL